MLAVSLALLVVLGILGAGVEGKLSPTSLEIPGSESARATHLLREHFGDSAPFAILLRGPERQLDRQGPRVVRALRRSSPAVTTLSPWDRGSVQQLRPGPRRAIVLADFHVGVDEAVNDTVPELNEILADNVQPPVRWTQTGYATLSRAIQDDSIAATERGELIALPILLIVLLLVFRSPVAAAIPLAFGAVTVISSRGLLAIVTNWFSIDAFALTVCTMMGLALGVDYALLMVSRFREELANGTSPRDAARATRRTAGRTTVFAGSTLMLSMLVAFFIVPGSLLGSLAATLLLVVALSVLVAVVVGPAVLTLLGPNVDRWRIGRPPGEGGSRLMTVVGAALRRPLPVALAIGLVLLILAVPAIGLKTGPPSQTQLAHDEPARKDFELIERSIGPGYDAPFVVVAAAEERHRHRTPPARGPEPLAAPDRGAARRPGGGRPGADLQGGEAAAPGERAAGDGRRIGAAGAADPPGPQPRAGGVRGRAAARRDRQSELRRRAAGRGVGQGAGRGERAGVRARAGGSGQRTRGGGAAHLR